MSGWIKLYRDIQHSEIWEEKPFDKRSAWIDLLLTANYEDRQFILGNELIEAKRGSIITSEVKLADRWGWSRHKVRDFLTTLEKRTMIVKNSDTKRTVLNIVNYSVWQDCPTAEEHQKDSKRTSKGQQKDTNKNIRIKKDIKNEKNISHELATAIEDFKEFRKTIKRPMGDKAVQLLLDKLGKLAPDDETRAAILNQSIINGWQGVFPLKQEVLLLPRINVRELLKLRDRLQVC